MLYIFQLSFEEKVVQKNRADNNLRDTVKTFIITVKINVIIEKTLYIREIHYLYTQQCTNFGIASSKCCIYNENGIPKPGDIGNNCDMWCLKML